MVSLAEDERLLWSSSPSFPYQAGKLIGGILFMLLSLIAIASTYLLFPKYIYYSLLVSFAFALIGIILILYYLIKKRATRYIITNLRIIKSYRLIGEEVRQAPIRNLASIRTRRGVINRLMGNKDIIFEFPGTQDFIVFESVKNADDVERLIFELKGKR